MYYTRELNILVMGEDAAHHLGINTFALKTTLLITCAVIVGSVVSTENNSIPGTGCSSYYQIDCRFGQKK